MLKLPRNNPSGVTVPRPARPGSRGSLDITPAFDPVVVKAKDLGFRDGSGDVDSERNMIRSATSEGGKNRRRQGCVPSKVDEGTVQSLQSGILSFVRPRELPIKKRQLKETKIINTFIEGISFCNSEVIVVLFTSIPNHVKVSKNEPGAASRNRNVPEFIEEFRSELRSRWGIHIGDMKGEVGGGGGEADGESVGGRRRRWSE